MRTSTNASLTHGALPVWTAVLLALAAAGCGAAAAPSRIGTSHAPRPEDAIEMVLHTTDGRVVALADQQGAPVLLHLFATYDGASLANHRELSRFAREHMDTVVLGVAIQPDAATFATAFAESQSPPYTVVYDDTGTVVHGTSDLGELEAIPTVVMIDAHGRECARHVGYASTRVLESMHDIALSRGGIVATPEPAPSEAEPPPEREPAGDPEREAPAGEQPAPEVGEGEVVIEP